MRQQSATIILSTLLALSWIGFWASAPRAAQDVEASRAVWIYRTTDDQQIKMFGEGGWEAYAVTKSEDGKPTYYLKQRSQ